MRKIIFTKGYSLIELIIVIAILFLILSVWGAFQTNIFSMNRIIQVGINNQYEAKKIIRPFAGEIRSVLSSDLGSYPIEMAGTSTLVFYSNIDNDSKIERVRYFLDGNIFKKGVVKSSGDPLNYNLENEQIIQVVHNVKNQPIFSYYDSNYDGTVLNGVLDFPINVADIRLVKITLEVENKIKDEIKSMIFETQVSIRNLKDNR